MPKLSGNNDCFLKFDLTTAERERFREACELASEQTGQRWSMARMLRAFVLMFADEMFNTSEEQKLDA